jgi:hypothetical protein
MNQDESTRIEDVAVILALATVALALSASNTHPECPRYYMVLFGGQSERLRPKSAHTWATYVKVTPGAATIEEFTISWLPASLNVRPGKLRAEPGTNLSLEQTLGMMTNGNHSVSFWGPFEIGQEFYEESYGQKCFLESGMSQYHVLSVLNRRPDVNHCVHAIVRANPTLQRICDPVLWYGEAITQRVANALATSGIVAQPYVTHDWLIPVLGLDRYRMSREPVGQLPLTLMLPRR